MPVAYVGAAAGLAAAGSSIANMASGPAPSTGTYGGNPNTYIPTAQPAADQYYQNIFSGMYNATNGLPSQLLPAYQSYVGNLLSDPYASEALGGATQAANYGLTLTAPQQTNMASSLYGAGNNVLGTAFDSQNALYNQLQQQTTDQANAVNSMYGLGSSPYGAGNVNQALQNFNINWQNQQLQRQMQGIQSAGQAYSGASNLYGQSAATQQAAGALPYQTYTGLQQGDIGALNSLAAGYNTAFGPQESLANLLQSYLGLGQSATGLAQAGQQQGFNQNQILGQQLATSLTNPALTQGLSNLFNGSSSSNVGNLFSPSAGYQGTYGDYAPDYSNVSPF